MLDLQCELFSTSVESWYTNLERTPEQVSTTTCALQTTYPQHKQNRQTDF